MYTFLTQHNFDIDCSDETKKIYSHDASICEVVPQCVVFPKNSEEISLLINLVNEYKKTFPSLSLTMRSRGTCMSGGSLNDSIIVDTTKYMDHVGEVNNFSIITQPGAFYKHMEEKTLQRGMVMPAFTASKNLCGTGGMFANNCAGEQTLKFGKAQNWILQTKFIGVDTVERMVKPLTRGELGKLMTEDSWWGNVNRNLFELIMEHDYIIKKNIPKVSKNSAGYNIWDIWNEQTGVWDINKLLCGSQGTLGVTSEITWKLHNVEPETAMVVVFLKSLDDVPSAVNMIKKYQPNSIESYDDTSFSLALKYWKDFIESMGLWGAIKLGLRFIPELIRIAHSGLPKFVLVVELQGNDKKILHGKAVEISNELDVHGHETRIPTSEGDKEKYWRIRRESFNLLRKHLHGTRTAPFIDDTVVNVEFLPQYMKELRAILDEYQLQYTIAGHAGNGNFHIIPLMDFKDYHTLEVIKKVSDKIFSLVKKYGGTTTGEHNDGLIRTPYLNYVFDNDMLELFKKVKMLFDPHNIFNPRKKVGGSKEYLYEHIVKTS